MVRQRPAAGACPIRGGRRPVLGPGQGRADPGHLVAAVVIDVTIRPLGL